jgi:hypothetical protein
MKFRLLDGGLSVDSDAQAIDKLTQRMIALSTIIDLFNASDWQPPEVRMWLQYEKDLALVESKLYTQEQEQQ